MKRLLTILIIPLLIFGLSGCESGEKITEDNYDDYLDISVTFNKIPMSSKRTELIGASGIITVNGVSQKYDYKDVKIIVTITGVYSFTRAHTHLDEQTFNTYGSTRDFSVDVPIELNIAGNGSGTYEVPFDNYWAIAPNVKSSTAGYDTYSDLVNSDPDKWHDYFPTDANASYDVKIVKGKLVK